MLYHLHELQHALLKPARMGAEYARMFWSSPLNPLSYSYAGRTMAAGVEMFERTTRRFGKPSFGLKETVINGKEISVSENIVAEKPFCHLKHFKRDTRRNDPRVLIVAPMSGHHATLLRGTVEALLPHHDVYITDWIDARHVTAKSGRFNLDDYITYLWEFLSLLGPDTHVMAVCQPAVPVFATIALMESQKDPNCPRSMTLMGGPIDPRVSKTAVTELAETRPLSWFENTVVHDVPFYYPGAGRKVYPGFIQLSGFMTMNLDTHIGKHMKFFHHLIIGDGDSAEAHRKFYNEYNSVMDITAEFYLQTVEEIFQKHSLPQGQYEWTDPLTGEKHLVNPSAIKHTALLTVEGELDDISALGQTEAAHRLCTNLPRSKKYHHFQESVGHYGIFNGRRWRSRIMPRIRHFIRKHDPNVSVVPKADLSLTGDLKPAAWDPEKHSVEAIQRSLQAKQTSSQKSDMTKN